MYNFGIPASTYNPPLLFPGLLQVKIHTRQNTIEGLTIFFLGVEPRVLVGINQLFGFLP